MSEYIRLAILKHLEEKVLTQTDFAHQIGIDRTTLLRICNGASRMPQKGTLARIAAGLGISTQQLIEGSTQEEAPSAPVFLGEDEIYDLLDMYKFLERPIELHEIPGILSLMKSKRGE